MKLNVTSRGAEFVGRDKIEALFEGWIKRHVRPWARLHGFADKELSAIIRKQDDDEGSFLIRLHMHVPPNTILVARGRANQLQPAVEEALSNKRQSRRSRLDNLKDHQDKLSTELLSEANTSIKLLLPKLKSAIERELTFLRSQGDLPFSYPATQDILDEVIASAILDWKPGIDSEAAYLRLLREMHKVLNKEVGASHAYGDIVSLDTLAPKDAIEQAESMVGEEFYEFYQPDELLKIEDLIVDEKALMSLENGQDDQKISYLLRLLKELPIKWRRAFMLHELENIPVKKLAGLMDINTDKIIEWIDYTNNYLNARLMDAGFEAGIGSMLSDLRSNDR